MKEAPGLNGLKPTFLHNLLLSQSLMSGYTISDDLLFGRSEPMQKLRLIVDRIAEAAPPVLIEGESGTGKEALARAIHLKSIGRSRAFLKINCLDGTALPSLDNVEKWIEGAGTLLLDDVCELEAGAQSKLMRIFDSCNSDDTGQGLHVISTATKSLEARVSSGMFRQDLYYRLAVVKLCLPPLRERRIDIPAIAFHLLSMYSELYQHPSAPFSDRLMNAFLKANWDGNIRELENVVKQYVILGSEEAIIAAMQKSDVATGQSLSGASLKALRRNAVRECEYKAILASLNRNHWNRINTARELRISYRSLLYAMKQLGLPAKRTRTNSGHSVEVSSDTSSSPAD